MTSPSPSIEQYVLAKAPTKSLLHSSCSNFAICGHSNVLSSEKNWTSPEESSVLWSTVCAISSKLLTIRASVYKLHYWNPKLRLDQKNQKTISSLTTTTISLNIQIDIFVYCSDLETTILASFSSKSLNYTVISQYLQNLSTLTFAKLSTSTRTVITFQTSVKYLRAFTTCSIFTPDCRYDMSIIKLIGNVHCLNTMCSDILCLHRKSF